MTHAPGAHILCLPAPEALVTFARRDDRHHTFAEYQTWPDTPRCELIDGQFYAMSPAPEVVHQDIVLALATQLFGQLEGHPCRVFVAPLDVRLPKAGQDDAGTDTVVQPDVLVVCDPAKIDRRGVRGAPDWVAEVISPSSASHDLIRKRRAYEAAGVREYWVVHPTDRVVMIYDFEGAKYDVFDMEGVMPIGALPGVSVDWTPIVQKLPAIEP